MRNVETRRPSFPNVAFNAPLPWPTNERWHVVCGDEGHWRVGMYSPGETKPEDLPELEQHDCPELFVLMRGNLTLIVAQEGSVQHMPLELGVPVLVTSPHAGFCPDGPHSGVALVVERDSFDTVYQSPEDWTK